MNKTLLELRNSIYNEFSDIIHEHGTNSVQGTWLQMIDQELHTQVTNRLSEIDDQIKAINFNLEEMLENKVLSITHESYMADIFMRTSDLREITNLLREQFGPKS